jgi:hypothetical protein
MRQDISVMMHPICAIEWYILDHTSMARRYARWRIHYKSPYLVTATTGGGASSPAVYKFIVHEDLCQGLYRFSF